MRPTGKVNLIGLLMILGVIAAIYWAVFFGTLHIDNFDVKDAVNIAFNSYGKESPEAVRWNMKRAFSDPSLGTHLEYDHLSGTEKELPGLPISDDQITIAYDESRKILKIRVEYDRVVVLKPTSKKRTVHFVVLKEGTLGK